jgi:hypothetical protein
MVWGRRNKYPSDPLRYCKTLPISSNLPTSKITSFLVREVFFHDLPKAAFRCFPSEMCRTRREFSARGLHDVSAASVSRQ